jgi:hypothetical protein
LKPPGYRLGLAPRDSGNFSKIELRPGLSVPSKKLFEKRPVSIQMRPFVEEMAFCVRKLNRRHVSPPGWKLKGTVRPLNRT